MGDHGVRAAAHVTGGGWTNLLRMGERRYVIDDPHPAQPIFEFVQTEGNVTDEEMHRTFNMGTGFVVALPEDRAGRSSTRRAARSSVASKRASPSRFAGSRFPERLFFSHVDAF